jgi:tetratricopeptide (TPR) repeat protein
MRRKLNLPLLTGVLAGLVLAGAGLHFLHEYQVRHNAGVLLRQADGAAALGQLRQAAAYLRQYLAYEPKDTAVLARYALTLDKLAQTPDEHYQAWLLLEQAVRREPGRSDLREESARLALSLYRYEEAARHLEALLRATPANAELAYALGWCREAAGEYARAVAAYGQAARHDPKCVEAYQRQADLLETRLERPEQAGKVLDRMVAANPQSSQAYLIRARHRQRLGSLEEAWADLGRARELAWLGAEVALKRHDPERAVALARQAVPADSRDYRDHLWHARVLEAAGRAAEAEAVLRRAVQTAGPIPDAWVALVQHLAQHGHHARAEAVLEEVRRALPPERVLPALARCHEALGQLDQAERLFQQQQADRPDDWLATRGLAEFYLRSGRPAQAEPWLRRLLDPASDVPAEVAARARRQLREALQKAQRRAVVPAP